MFRVNSSYLVGTCIDYLENFLHFSLIPDLLGSLSCNYLYIPSGLASCSPVPRSLSFSPAPSTKSFHSARQLFWAGRKLNLWKQPCALPLSRSLSCPSPFTRETASALANLERVGCPTRPPVLYSAVPCSTYFRFPGESQTPIPDTPQTAVDTDEFSKSSP